MSELSTNKELRRILVEDQKLDGIVSMPAGVFKPYAGVSTAILLFTKTNSGGTDRVWFYDLEADGYSLDDKRTPLLSDDKLGLAAEALSDEEHAKNNLPDALVRWRQRDGTEAERARTEQSFCVPNQRHADFIKERFDANYPKLDAGNFARVITHQVNYAQSLIDDFSNIVQHLHDTAMA